MLKITKQSDDRVDITLSGKIDGLEMAVALDELIGLSDDISNGQMLYEISDFSVPTLGAIGIEISRLPKLFRLIAKFDRCAVISDSNWLRTAATVEGALFPGLEIKSYEPQHRANAEAWLQGGA